MTSKFTKISEDCLENLDNASLRKKWLEFGLPNVPITDASRNLFIKKLRVAMTEKPADKKKNSRETKHVSKISSPVDGTVVEETPKRITRSQTAAARAACTVDDAILSTPTKPEKTVNRRRSVRAQDEKSIPITPLTTKKQTPDEKRETAVVLEETDEDEDDVGLPEVTKKSERAAKEVIPPRYRRSVSLSKTGVVTVSYGPSDIDETKSEFDNDFSLKYEQVATPISQPQSSLFELPERKISIEPDPTSSLRTTVVNITIIDPEPLYDPTLPSPSCGLTSSSITYGCGSSTASTTKYADKEDDESDEEDEGNESSYRSSFVRMLERLKLKQSTKETVEHDIQRNKSPIQGRHSISQNDSLAD